MPWIRGPYNFQLQYWVLWTTAVKNVLSFPQVDATDASYPSVNTCVHYLKLPEYSSEEIMRERLLAATMEKGFHLNWAADCNMGHQKVFFDTSEASCVCVQKVWSPRCALMRLAFFFTCEALGTCGISLLAANDKRNPCNYTASKKLAQNTVWCFKGLHNWKLRWFCLTVPKNRSSDFQCSLIQISNSVFV